MFVTVFFCRQLLLQRQNFNLTFEEKKNSDFALFLILKEIKMTNHKKDLFSSEKKFFVSYIHLSNVSEFAN